MMQAGLAGSRQLKAAHEADLSIMSCAAYDPLLELLRSLHRACCLWPDMLTSTHTWVLPTAWLAAYSQSYAGCAGVVQPSSGGPQPRQACQTASSGCERHPEGCSAQAAELGMSCMR